MDMMDITEFGDKWPVLATRTLIRSPQKLPDVYEWTALSVPSWDGYVWTCHYVASWVSGFRVFKATGNDAIAAIQSALHQIDIAAQAHRQQGTKFFFREGDLRKSEWIPDGPTLKDTAIRADMYGDRSARIQAQQEFLTQVLE